MLGDVQSKLTQVAGSWQQGSNSERTDCNLRKLTQGKVLNFMLLPVCVLSRFTPGTIACQAPPSVGFSRWDCWRVAMPSSRGSSQPWDQTYISYISCIGRQVLYHYHHWGNPFTFLSLPYNSWSSLQHSHNPKRLEGREYRLLYCENGL